MNPLVRRYLRTAIAFLIIGLGIGIWMMYAREFGAFQPPRVRSAHTHALLVGFVMLMITGVALWMFPRPRQDDQVYRPGLASAAWWAIALGTGTRVLLELVLPANAPVMWRGLLVAAGVVQALGMVLFFGTMWTRIRSSGAASERRT
ncbi:cbb3-type cytochrome c oxidase subunit I [Gemmatimonas aurantiaca]|uniref:cbb3-type cytochrome c oxidase subunit I n=1 Tax=Gemmatimonas aurantiaca TaxID=173480 RepID=UPI00301BCBBB